MVKAHLGIVHFSDVHFGRAIGGRNHHKWPWRLSNGHDWALAEGFKEVVGQTAANPSIVSQYLGLRMEDMRYVMSGDLTARGHVDDFVLGQSYVYEVCRIDATIDATLGFRFRPIGVTTNPANPDPDFVMVEGNHDAWCGRGYPGQKHDPSLAGRQFRKTPWVVDWECDDFVLEVVGLNSNRGWKPTKADRDAVGKVDLSQNGEIDEIERVLNARKAAKNTGKPLFRAAVIHHPVVRDSRNGESLAFDSRFRLRQLADRCGISVFLTGHTHDFWGEVLQSIPGVHMRACELRSASTIQGLESRLTPDPPGFLLHRLRLIDSANLEWKCFRWIWDKDHGFIVDDDDNRPTRAADKAGFMKFRCAAV